MWELLLGFLGTSFLGTLGWTVRLGNRVSVLEAQKEDLEKLINYQFLGVNQRLERIERGMNGHLKGVD